MSANFFSVPRFCEKILDTADVFRNAEKWGGTNVKQVVMGLVCVSLLGCGVSEREVMDRMRRVRYGVTFSAPSAEALFAGTEKRAQNVLEEITSDLRIRRFRLPLYWDVIQPKSEKDWRLAEEFDWQLDAMKKARASEVIVCLGRKVPGEAGYREPAWVKQLSRRDAREALLRYIRRVVKTYAENRQITAWQIEEIPYDPIGDNEEIYGDQETLLKQEVAMVRSHDPLRRLIIVTDREHGKWQQVAARGDILGLSLGYQNMSLALIPGIPMSLATAWWRFKIRHAEAPAWITELRALPETPDESVVAPKRIVDLTKFAVGVGIEDIYFLGVEWWAKKKEEGNPALWEVMRKMVRAGEEGAYGMGK